MARGASLWRKNGTKAVASLTTRPEGDGIPLVLGFQAHAPILTKPNGLSGFLTLCVYDSSISSTLCEVSETGEVAVTVRVPADSLNCEFCELWQGGWTIRLPLR
jgi:hypothetical protein